MPGYYAQRLKRLLRLQRQYGIVRPGDRIMELGTGWMHWDALIWRLFYDVRAVLFDVWDNRQMGRLKNYVRQLRAMLHNGFELSASELKRAQSLADAILKVESFEEMYKLLDFQYVVASSGSLGQFADNSFQLVVSGGVLEHVQREALPALGSETQRILKPGGWAVHSIDTTDHLQHYDQTASPKIYLSFSERTWKYLCENQVQYINRFQRGEWLELFKSSGFELEDEEVFRVDISGLRLAERYVHMDKGDLECTTLNLALKKASSAQ
jgi:SAM-dependent methyltransferase